MVDSPLSPKLLMLRGLPASGKTTYANGLADEGWGVASKDTIRSLEFPHYNRKDEKKVIDKEDELVIRYLQERRDVVVDDTNLNPVHEKRLRKIADELGAEFHIKDFDVPLEECIKRNAKRGMKVPTSAIVDMHKKYIKPPKKVEYDDNLEECIIVDVDGTLAHITDRNPYDASRAMEDTLDDAVSSIVNIFYRDGYKIIVLTGRHSGHLDVTKRWLEQEGVNYDEIYCRQEGDKRADTIIKEELYREHIEGKYNVKFIIDDRPSVCRMWRSLGLKTLQVGDPHEEF